ncbi:ARM repeat-containing protein [Phanerochaete sordida]|uniref:ARM repeat-containing protein n=1 Tax=Phanerochaete sordida TaxID=48140 RepID=A0A9P3LKL5_9APHY|nr:ARM repeat-containing protein [Phanerochaete sordida]
MNVPSSATQSFGTLFDPSTRRQQAPPPGLSASIWAPQPQPSETTWSRAIDSISRLPEGYGGSLVRPDMHRTSSHPAGRNSEDVFGPVGLPPGVFRKKDVGAIGDGRKKTPPDFDLDPIHVQQLLRTLNLNSPGPLSPTIQTQGLGAPSVSPDVSPISTTSALLTPPELSPAKPYGDWKFNPAYDFGSAAQLQGSNALLFETESQHRYQELFNPMQNSYDKPSIAQSADPFQTSARAFGSFEPFADRASFSTDSFPRGDLDPSTRQDSNLLHPSWSHQRVRTSSSEWAKTDDRRVFEHAGSEGKLSPTSRAHATAHEPINFLSLLHPSSSPPYPVFVSRIIKSSDQQASIFLQQKLKVADSEERAKIVDAICARGFEMMAHRFGNWAVQRCLEATSSIEERRKIVSCMRGRVVDLATNCYGCHVLQKALDCEEDIRLLIVSELLLHDPAQTLVNKHASHVWSKIMELTWTAPAPPIFAYVNRSLNGKWAALACHETGSLVVQHAFENLEESAKDGIVDELLNQGAAVFGEVAKNQWGSYCVQHILEHGSTTHRTMALDHLISGLLEYATSEQGAKSVTKALKEGGKDTLDRVITRMCEPAKGGRRAMIVDLALSSTGSQLIASVLPNADKDQRALLYESIRGHIVTLRGCKTGSKVIWLFDRMRAYYGY